MDLWSKKLIAILYTFASILKISSILNIWISGQPLNP